MYTEDEAMRREIEEDEYYSKFEEIEADIGENNHSLTYSLPPLTRRFHYSALAAVKMCGCRQRRACWHSRPS